MGYDVLTKDGESGLKRWSCRLLVFGLAAMLGGCMAQQADVKRIKRELNAKISQLDKSKTSLQQAVTDANAALEKANVLIAQQRAEIKELLHARAEVMDQVATLKDTDLSQVRGAIEQNQHQVGELKEKLGTVDGQMQMIRNDVDESRKAIEPLVDQLRDKIRVEEQLRTEQGGKLGEFRTSLVDYQEVLAALRKNVVQQEQQVLALQRQVDRLSQQQATQHQQVQADVKDVRQHVQSVIGTLEQISDSFSSRLDAYEQQRAQVSQHTPSSSALSAGAPSAKPFASQPQDSGPLTFSRKPSSQTGQLFPSQQGPSSTNVTTGSVPAYAPTADPLVSTPAVKSSTEPVQELTQDAQHAYHRAFNLLRVRNYRDAAKQFSAFLRTFPDSPLAANGQYWLGECYYGQRRFQEAIDEFERVFAFYPSSNKVPASLLKIGYSHLELKQPSMARSVFQQLVRTYPQSPAAIKAHGRLQEVNALLHNPS